MRRNRAALRLPWMLAELTLASCETILHRTSMIALGQCSDAEYRRMIAEKLAAARKSNRAFQRKGKVDPVSLLAPWHTAASRNAKRLRRKGHKS